MRSEVKRWGGSVAVRLPTRILAKANLEIGSSIAISVDNGKIVVKPLAKESTRVNLPFTEADLLDQMTAESAHADELASPEGDKLDH